MKSLTIFLSLTLAASLGLNAWLWQQRTAQLAATETARAGVAEAEELRAENEMLKTQRTAKPAASDADAREVARLRNEVGQHRQQKAQADAQQARTAQELAQLRAQLTGAKENLETINKGTEALLKMAAEKGVEARQRAQAIACVNNLKQIGLAARIYAKDHGKVFPPNFVAMKDELGTPKILFCPAAPGGAQARTWEELNPTMISYQFQNPGGDESDPQKLLTTCPIHGNYGLSDGSVQMPRK